MIKVAVVTPYCRESLSVVKRCHDSVMAQTHKTDHFLIADGHPHAEIDAWNCTHIKLPAHKDVGDTPRLIGTASAAGLGYHAILLLDADNSFDPDHVETMLAIQAETGAAVVTCARKLLRAHDYSLLAIDTESDGDAFNDTNCLMMTRPTFPLFGTWGFKDMGLGPVGDRIFWNAVKRSNLKIARSSKPSINYTTTYACHFLQHGEQPPAYAKDILRTPDGVWRIVPWAESIALQKAAQDAAAKA